jgi:hypothetical protein
MCHSRLEIPERAEQLGCQESALLYYNKFTEAGEDAHDVVRERADEPSIRSDLFIHFS